MLFTITVPTGTGKTQNAPDTCQAQDTAKTKQAKKAGDTADAPDTQDAPGTPDAQNAPGAANAQNAPGTPHAQQTTHATEAQGIAGTAIIFWPGSLAGIFILVHAVEPFHFCWHYLQNEAGLPFLNIAELA